MEATAKYDFKATGDDELSFREGQQLNVSNIFYFNTTVHTLKSHVCVCMKNVLWNSFSLAKLIFSSYVHTRVIAKSEGQFIRKPSSSSQECYKKVQYITNARMSYKLNIVNVTTQLKLESNIKQTMQSVSWVL